MNDKPAENMNPFIKIQHRYSSDHFFGRQSELYTIIQGVSATRPTSFLVEGAARIGKTHFLRYLCHAGRTLIKRYSDDNGNLSPDNFIFLFFDQQESGLSRENIDALISEVMQNCRRRHPASRPGTTQNVNHAKADSVSETLSAFHKEGIRFVICVDNFDGDLEYGFFESREAMTEQSRFHAFVFCREALSNRPLPHGLPLNCFDYLQLGLLKPAEARQMVQHPAKSAGQPFNMKEVDFILSLAGRHPYCLVAVAGFFFELRTEYGLEHIDEYLSVDTAKHISLRMLGRPAIRQFHDYLWNNLSKTERDALFLILEDKFDQLFPTHQDALSSLILKTIVYDNILDGKYHVFSKLFGDYISQYRPSAASHTKSNGSQKSTRDFFIHFFKKNLTPKDRKVFEYMANHPDKICDLAELKKIFWHGEDEHKQKRGLDAAIHRIRKSFRDSSVKDYLLVNKHGVGYKFWDFIRELTTEQLRFYQEIIYYQ